MDLTMGKSDIGDDRGAGSTIAAPGLNHRLFVSAMHAPPKYRSSHVDGTPQV
jgi:hypothetical protein